MNDSEIIDFVKPYTSVSRERIQNVLELVELCVKENIHGDFAEIGVFRGGLIMAMALKCKQLGVSRTIHAYDTFQGMTPESSADVDRDGIHASRYPPDNVKCFSSFQETSANIRKADYPYIVYHIGDILQTDKSLIPTLALLRLDTDWYESTKFELDVFEPKVSTNGCIIVDDYGHWQGCRKAVDEFRPPYKNIIDYTGIWWRKDYGRSRLEMARQTEYTQTLLANFHHFVGLNGSFHQGCGSYMFDGQRYLYQIETLKKQEELYAVGKEATHLLEVGVYVGHSLLILLLSNPNLRITCVDIEHDIPQRAVTYLNQHFGNRITFLHGRAEDILPTLPKHTFDAVHIDADHNPDAVTRQFNLCVPLATRNAYFVFDDYEAVQSVINEWIQTGLLHHIATPWCLWTNCITRINKVSL
jgi:O-methyltransferase